MACGHDAENGQFRPHFPQCRPARIPAAPAVQFVTANPERASDCPMFPVDRHEQCMTRNLKSWAGSGSQAGHPVAMA